MNERIIDIILYLVNQIRKDTPIDSIDVQSLEADGYTDAEIGAAFSWLADREAYGERGENARVRGAFRVLHDSERAIFRTEAYGYLLQLYHIGVLNDPEMETLVNRAHLSNMYGLAIADIKELVSGLLAESGDLGFGGSRLMLNSNDVIH
jgi:uncharacterized protein Smg (DUF494 family)